MTVERRYSVARLEQLKFGPHDTVLDLGAGTGYYTSIIARRAKRVIAIDHSLQMLGELNKRLSALGLSERVEWRKGRAEPFRESLRPRLMESCAAY